MKSKLVIYELYNMAKNNLKKKETLQNSFCGFLCVKLTY